MQVKVLPRDLNQPQGCNKYSHKKKPEQAIGKAFLSGGMKDTV